MTKTSDDPSRELIQAALAARPAAHAPYSKYRVGAALLCEDGSIVQGVNVENASYGLTICAERVAIGTWVASQGTPIQAVVVATQDGASPCGACRQVLSEFLAPHCKIFGVNAQGEVVGRWDMKMLLPAAFDFEG